MPFENHVNKRKTPRERMLSLCREPHPEDGTDPRRIKEEHATPRKEHRQRALCAQVRKIVTLVLCGDARDQRLAAIEVVAVEPGPGGRLIVQVGPRKGDPEAAPGAILDRLQALRPFLRQEVAAAIRRRRAPDLTFQWLPVGGGDES